MRGARISRGGQGADVALGLTGSSADHTDRVRKLREELLAEEASASGEQVQAAHVATARISSNRQQASVESLRKKAGLA